MEHKDNVKRIYSIFNARWYDPFRKVWTRAVSDKAEKEFVELLKEKIKPTTKILELGCGTGINIGRIKSLGLKFDSYTAMDFSDEMLNIAKEKYNDIKNLKIIKRDITTQLSSKLSNKKNEKNVTEKYDLIISTWVLSHLSSPSKTINMWYHQLNKGGAMLLVFLTKPKWHIHFWFYLLERLFAAKYVKEEEINKMDGEKIVKKYSSGLTTLLKITRLE